MMSSTIRANVMYMDPETTLLISSACFNLNILILVDQYLSVFLNLTEDIFLAVYIDRCLMSLWSILPMVLISVFIDSRPISVWISQDLLIEHLWHRMTSIGMSF